MFLTMGVSLYTSRVVLNALGVRDYGIYNVVGGLIATFAIFSSSINGAISRFMSFELGKQNSDFNKIFNISFLIQVGLAITIVIFIETLGVWFLNNKMTIEPSRLNAANWVLQCSATTFVIGMLTLPFNSAIISHERMNVFAYVSIAEVLIKLGIVLTLQFCSFADNLKTYAFLIMIANIIPFLLYRGYCVRNLNGCHLRLVWDKAIFKEMLGFSIWNFVGVCASIGRDQGVNLIVNVFYGTVINAARGIATQVSAAVNQFVSNFMKAVDPQIIKLYAAEDVNDCHTLVYRASKFGFMMVFCVTFPVIINIDAILSIWLKIVPEHSANFVTLMLIFLQIETLTYAFNTLMLATSKIRTYQLIAGGIQILNIPFSYWLLKSGYNLNSPYYVLIILSVACFFARLFILKRTASISLGVYFRTVILRLLAMIVLVAPIPLFFKPYIPKDFLGCAGSFMITLTICIICAYFIGCNNNEKNFIKSKLDIVFNKLKK